MRRLMVEQREGFQQRQSLSVYRTVERIVTESRASRSDRTVSGPTITGHAGMHGDGVARRDHVRAPEVIALAEVDTELDQDLK